MAEEQSATEEKKGKGLIFIIVGVVVAVLILIGVVVFLFMGGDEESDHGGGNIPPPPQVANLSPEQQALLQNEAYRNPVAIMPLEKEFVINLKSPDPENMRSAGFAKFKATLLLADKNAVKEVDVKLDIVRNIIADSTSAYLATELQGSQGRQKLANAIVASLNSVLTDGKVTAVVFPDFILQP
ncbi:flagellar basal body-associated FliL family protein [Helicobacter trogontum]|uniref:Flagellar protein FliL n=1 Tax=Helicobacter trogontum TaxID=50960 RepID=A0A4U8TI27_9HELI|nr:flagellar basal body-associated FliL family protein [Helicobacter trogontum]MCI5787116.1 flagellar basal body-associated FliL family protein [Helicobacter trogontum]MDY5184486.1 flagellar basal body-associated FliL family protein [Helicobacter trogontum]TLD99723.1 hypothetical protein LS80_000525 [Helicobacter trogontum]